MNDNDQAKSALHDLVKSVKEKTEDQISGAYFASVFEMSPMVDTFATWLLAVVGGTAALTITKIKSISAIIPFENIKIGLGFLLVSGLFGFLEKFLAFNVQATIAQESKLKAILGESSEEFDKKIREYKVLAEAENIDINAELDTEKALKKFIEAHPWHKRIQLEKTINTEDALKKRLRRYYRQVLYTVLEFIGFLVFVLIAILSL